MRKLRGIVSWGRCPQAPGILPLYRQNGYGKETALARLPAIPAAGSALRSHPCVALSSAQVFPGWTTIASPCNDLSSHGDYPLTLCLSPGVQFIYDCSRSIRHPSGRPLESRTSPTEEETGSSLRFLGHPCGACPGLGTPASGPDLANSGRCPILPSAELENVGLATMNDFGAEPSRPASLLSTLRHPPVAR